MNLSEAFSALDTYSDDLCICARKPWSPESECVVTPLEPQGAIPSLVRAHGLDYFLEIAVCKEVLEVLGDRTVQPSTALQLLIYYAENDAYPEWVYRS